MRACVRMDLPAEDGETRCFVVDPSFNFRRRRAAGKTRPAFAESVVLGAVLLAVINCIAAFPFPLQRVSNEEPALEQACSRFAWALRCMVIVSAWWPLYMVSSRNLTISIRLRCQSVSWVVRFSQWGSKLGFGGSFYIQGGPRSILLPRTLYDMTSPTLWSFNQPYKNHIPCNREASAKLN